MHLMKPEHSIYQYNYGRLVSYTTSWCLEGYGDVPSWACCPWRVFPVNDVLCKFRWHV